MATKGSRGESHVIRLDQIPRWIEQEPTVDSFRLAGPNGLPVAPSGASGDPSATTDPLASTSLLPVPLLLPPLPPLPHSSGAAGGNSVLLEPSTSLGDTDLVRKSYSSPFHDPLTLKPKGPPKAGGMQEPLSRFPVDPEVNSRILLWRGDPWNLEVDAVVNSTNEAMEASASSPNLHTEAGPSLAEECAALGGCRTGEVKVSGAYALPARQIFHTVGPRYSAKYLTAAENALSSCYRSCLELLVELGLHSIAFGCLYTESKGYPREQAAHVAIRTVRRFLEKHSAKVTAVVFCLQSEHDNDIYRKLLPLYFPRDKAEEEAALQKLPEDTGDENGGALSHDRMIRIFPSFTPIGGGTPKSAFSGFYGSSWQDTGDALVAKEFLEVAKDPDQRRQEQWAKSAAAQANGLAVLNWIGLENVTGPNLTIGEEFVLHQRYLSHAMKLDFTQLTEMKILCRGGVDKAGRQVIAIVGAHFLPRCIDLESFVLYVVKELEAVMHRPFCIVYYHATVHLPSWPNFAWIAKLHHILGPRHRRNLQVIYVVHPSVGLRTAIWALQTFVDPIVWKKVQYITRLVDLFRLVPRDQVTLPEFVVMHDIEVNPMDAITISYQAHASSQQRGLLLTRDF